MRGLIFFALAILSLFPSSVSIAADQPKDQYCQCSGIKDPDQRATCLKLCFAFPGPRVPPKGGQAGVPDSVWERYRELYPNLIPYKGPPA